MLRKIATLMMAFVLIFGLVACNNESKTTETTETETTESTEKAVETGSDFDTSADITVVSREDGSGTRGAFTEITGVLSDENGDEVDNTTVEAMIQNSTNGVMTAVAGDTNSIGYISLGSLNDSIRAIKINGIEATNETVKGGEYELARPFNIAWKDSYVGEIGEDLIKFIFSTEGQKIVEEEGYVKVEEGEEYSPANLEGQITVAGSTSVTPVMEKLAEAYKVHNPNVTIDIQSTGSSAGMTSAMAETAQIGMASRELKDEESAMLEYKPIAIDGIAVIVNNDNPLEDLTVEQVKEVFVGNILSWSEIE